MNRVIVDCDRIKLARPRILERYKREGEEEEEEEIRVSIKRGDIRILYRDTIVASTNRLVREFVTLFRRDT